ncbi:hypothetical protein GHT06_009812 [Daphnia sinensis]|uniref:Uncharacterized protein n=1 Tax=Daphnia sinensis TaxID=1820382 RepID=A0AAD5LXM1_9CRUS|nr:hypothetical protein GHT06_009812 [Daphnia sinensis]
MAKNGFRYRGFGSTSITPVIPKDKIIRPLFKKQEKSQSRPDWNASPKVREEKPIVSKTAMTGTKLEPFKARPVPRSHYDKPFRPVLPSKKDKKGQQNPVAELASRMWHAVVDPIFPPKEVDDEKPVDDEGTAQEPEEKETVSESPARSRKHSTSEAETDKVLPTEDALEPPANPGLVSRVWHSVVDPIFNPTNPDEEKLTKANAKENEQEPKAETPEVVENSAEDSPAELAPESPDETEKTPVMAESQPEEAAVGSLPSRIWHSIVDPILHPETKKAVGEEVVDEESSSKDLSENEAVPERDVEGAAGTQAMIKEHLRRPYSDSYLLKNRSEEMAEEGSARPGSFQSVSKGGEKHPEMDVEPSNEHHGKKQVDDKRNEVADPFEAQTTETRKKKHRVDKKNSQRKLTGNDE